MGEERRRSSAIRAWPEAERPRERLLQRGASALADAELLAILLRSGTHRASALDLGRVVKEQVRSLRRLGRLSAGELMRIPGIGAAKAAEILAALELGRRAQAEIEEDVPIVRSPEDVARVMLPFLRDLQHEVFLVLILDAKNGLRDRIELTRGTLTSSLVHPREVFKPAIDHRAAAIIVVHNHPSGNPEPSHEDIDVTRQLVETGKIVGIPLHDHIILAGDKYTSFAERGLL